MLQGQMLQGQMLQDRVRLRRVDRQSDVGRRDRSRGIRGLAPPPGFLVAVVRRFRHQLGVSDATIDVLALACRPDPP
jgi:hypothetical protein